MKRFLTAVLLVISAIGTSATASSLVFLHVTVIDVRKGSVYPDMAVIVIDTSISAVIPASRFQRGPNDRVIDSTGRFLIPGLWDMHVHLVQGSNAATARIRTLPLLIANGVTGVRDMGGDVQPLQDLKREIETGKLLGPRIVFSGPMIDGPDPPYPSSISVHTAAEASAAVDSLKKQQVDFIKVQSRLSKDAYLAVAQECHKQGMVFVGHVPDSITPAQASDAGQASQEHLLGLMLASSAKEEQLRKEQEDFAKHPHETTAEANSFSTAFRKEMIASFSEEKARNLFSEFVRNHTWQVPTLVFLYANTPTSLHDDITHDANLKYISNEDQQRRATERAEAFKGRSAENMASWTELYNAHEKLVAVMQSVGVQIMAGTDSISRYDLPGFSLHRELQLLVKAGLTPLQALQTATWNPAVFLGRENEAGTVEAGKRGDLLLLDDNPLSDITNTDKIQAVVIRGKYLGRIELDEMLKSSAQSNKTKRIVPDAARKAGGSSPRLAGGKPQSR